MCGFDIGYRKFSNILRGFNLLYFAGICFRGKRQNLRKLIHAKIMTGLFYLHIVIYYAISEWGRTSWILKRVYGKWCKLDFVPRRECTKYSHFVPAPRSLCLTTSWKKNGRSVILDDFYQNSIRKYFMEFLLPKIVYFSGVRP